MYSHRGDTPINYLEATKMKCDEVCFDAKSPKLLRKLMGKYGKSQSPFYGTNEDGDDIEIHIAETNIIYKTYQKNGWVRVNHFDENGFPAGETFEGRWDK